MSLVLTGDLGGTNIRYKLTEITPQSDTVLKSYVYPTSAYRGNIIGSIKEFLIDQPLPKMAVLGISGIVNKNKVTASLAFGSGLDNHKITAETGIPIVFILNDLEAFGYGILSLTDQNFVEINNGHKDNNGPIVCLSVGTGVGQCYLLKDNDYYKVYPSEGGFQDYSPKSQIEKKIYDRISEKYKIDGLTYSSLSGSTSSGIYLILREENKELINKEFDGIFMNDEKNRFKYMMEAGFNHSDQLAIDAVDIWQNILGHLIGNVAVNFLPLGGIYVGGAAIGKNFEDVVYSRKIIEGLYNGSTPVLHHIIHKIPIYIINSGDLEINGTLNFAKQKLASISSLI